MPRQFAWWGYLSDNGQYYAVKLEKDVAADGGFSRQAVMLGDKMFVWPWNHKDLRHAVYVGLDGNTLRLPIAYTNLGLWNKEIDIYHRGKPYRIIGYVTEKRPKTSLI